MRRSWFVPVLLATAFAGAAAPASAAPLVGERKVLVVLTNNGATTTRFSQATARANVFSDAESPARFYAENSQDRVKLVGRDDPAGDVIGPYDVGSLKPCQGDGSGPFRAEADRQAKAAGKNLDGYDTKIYVTTEGACPGLNGVGGTGQVTIIDNMPTVKLRPRTLAHELAHGFGQGHAGTMVCTDGADGPRVPLSGTCEDPGSNQSDPLDTMGTSGMDFGRLFSAPRIDELGWADPGEIRTVTATGTHDLVPLMSADGVRALTLARPGDPRSFWVEFRQPFGTFDAFAADDPAVNGLQVRLYDPKTHLSQLLDMRPQTTTFGDATLPVGQTFTDPVTGISITLTAVDPTTRRARVRVVIPGTTDTDTTPGTPNPEAPGTTGAPGPSTTPGAVAALQPAKLQVTRAVVNRATRRLSVLAPITARASGVVRGSFRAAGRTTRFTARVDATRRRIRVDQRLPAAQARLGTGILTLRYAGDGDTQPQTVRLRAAARPARLKVTKLTARTTSVRASGTISSRARGVVRMQLLYEPAGGSTRTISARGRISKGRFTVGATLPADVRTRRGVLHAYLLFTGDQRAKMRGELVSRQVLRAGV